MAISGASFPGWFVDRADGDTVASGVRWLSAADLPDVSGPSVLIEVEYSSLNYKDALACQGHRGVVRTLPHVPGIDCAGRVIRSDSDAYAPGDSVLVTGYGLGAGHWGGYSGIVRTPADWPVPLPHGMTTAQAMTYGTAGFTAAQCVMAIESRIAVDAGDVVVTGASGGVGSFAVAILAKVGYRVVAVTGKPEMTEPLKELGASEVVGREAVTDDGSAPLLSERWAAAVDTVGGGPLSNVLRSARYRAVVAACGLVAGADLPLTVYPFLLRGVTLAGIDSAKCPRAPRLEVWSRLSGPWRVDLPGEFVTEITLDQIPESVDRILAGKVAGRTLVRPVTDARSDESSG